MAPEQGPFQSLRSMNSELESRFHLHRSTSNAQSEDAFVSAFNLTGELSHLSDGKSDRALDPTV